MKSLFIGGPIDGQRTDTDGSERFEVMDGPDLGELSVDDASSLGQDADVTVSSEVDVYERVPLHIGLRGEVALYKHESVELEQCLPMLVDGYVSATKKDTSLKRVEKLEEQVARLSEENLLLKVKTASNLAMA